MNVWRYGWSYSDVLLYARILVDGVPDEGTVAVRLEGGGWWVCLTPGLGAPPELFFQTFYATFGDLIQAVELEPD
jgi:hypothetical protein